MAYVYILQSLRNGKYYIGSTLDLEERVKKHNLGQVYSTKRLLPLKIVFRQNYSDIQTARKIENKLKKFKRRDFLDKIIAEGKIRISVD